MALSGHDLVAPHMSAFDPKRTSVGLSPGEAARAVNWRRVNLILVRFVPMLPGQAFSFEKRTCTVAEHAVTFASAR